MNLVWEVKYLGPIKKYLGMVFQTNETGISINQTLYTNELLKLATMEQCKPTTTPMTTLPIPLKEDEHKKLNNSDACKFRSLVGGLLWLSLCTRPDISYAVSKLGSKISSPSENDHIILKRVLRYLQGSSEKGLFFPYRKETGGPT